MRSRHSTDGGTHHPLAAFVLLAPLFAATAAANGAASPDRREMEEILEHGSIGALTPISIGVTGSARAPITWHGVTHDAHVQTVDSYRRPGPRIRNRSDRYIYNVAAYRLDDMLGLQMVPVSVERRVGGMPAALTWWVDDVAMSEMVRRQRGENPPDMDSWKAQMNRAWIFHELAGNVDVNQTNLLITGEWRIWLIDFTRAFRTTRRLHRPEKLVGLDPDLAGALARLDEGALRTEMKGLLDVKQIRGILARRDRILERFRSLTPAPRSAARRLVALLPAARARSEWPRR